MNQGQITKSNKRGKSLYNLVLQEDIKVIVDIGTLFGNGSTKCILEAVQESNKKDFEVFSIECNETYYRIALKNLKDRPNNFHLMLGTLVNYEDLLPWEERLKDNKTGLEWLRQDLNNIKRVENVFDRLPQKIDLLVLDGGEFSSELEFKMLKERTEYFFLDDILSNKNFNNRKYMLDNPVSFKIIMDDLDNNFLMSKRLSK